MLEIYNQVLPSRSVPTLVALLILVAHLYAAQERRHRHNPPAPSLTLSSIGLRGKEQ